MIYLLIPTGQDTSMNRIRHLKHISNLFGSLKILIGKGTSQPLLKSQLITSIMFKKSSASSMETSLVLNQTREKPILAKDAVETFDFTLSLSKYFGMQSQPLQFNSTLFVTLLLEFRALLPFELSFPMKLILTTGPIQMLGFTLTM